LNGTRVISHNGHIRMMAAVQPFLSGAISKTVNMPQNSTIQDIFDVYVEAWKQGIKGVAIYRDNSKRSQPLQVKGADTKEKEEKFEAVRHRLPDERNAITHKFDIAGHEGYITVGLYDDGTPGELFIVMAKEGSTLSGVMDAFATSISIALQYGVPLATLAQKFSHMRFEPSGFTSNKDIPFAKSLLDYIFKWLTVKFLSDDEKRSIGVMVSEPHDHVHEPNEEDDIKVELKSKNSDPAPTKKGDVTFAINDDAPPCSNCGSGMMVRQGACYRCLNCGSQGGCG